MIQSPLNYTGGKFKLLPQILPLFPQNINVFVDLFCGGCNVGINVDCNRVIYNDLNENLLYLYNTFKNLDKQSVMDWIYQIIDKYDLSLVSKYGYDHRPYACDGYSVAIDELWWLVVAGLHTPHNDCHPSRCLDPR